MKSMRPQENDGEVFDSPGYWQEHKMQALKKEKELADELLPLHVQKHRLALQAIEKKNQAFASVSEELKAIDGELLALYSVQGKTTTLDKMKQQELDSLMLYSPLPYLRFLLQKRFFLKNKKNIAQEANKKEGLASAEHGSSRIEVGKKIFGILDNAWGWFQATFLANIPDSILNIFTGAFGFLLHLAEGIQGARDAYQAYVKEKIPQRKTKILTNALSFLIAGTGAGLSIALFVAILGAAVTAGTVTLAPILIPGFLVGIYGLALWRNAYVLTCAKEDESAAEEQYAQCAFSKNRVKAEMDTLEKQRDALPFQKILEKCSKKQVLTAEEEQHYESYKKHTKALLAKQVIFAQLAMALDYKQQRVKQCHEARFQAEREVTFNTIDIAASSLVLVATILSAAALIGGSVVTFGSLPLALLIIGVTVGIACQLFEHYDSQHDCRYTRNLRAWFLRQVDKLFKPAKKELSVEKTPTEKKYVSPLYQHFSTKKPLAQATPSASPSPRPSLSSATFINSSPDLSPHSRRRRNSEPLIAPRVKTSN